MMAGAFYNPLVRWLLRSPLHGLVSGNTLLLTYTGRRSGRQHSVPVNYAWAGDVIQLFSFRDRRWWRNLRGGVPVTVTLQGHDCAGRAEVTELGPAELQAAIRAAYPRLSAGRAAALAANMLMVRVRLAPAPEAAAAQRTLTR